MGENSANSDSKNTKKKVRYERYTEEQLQKALENIKNKKTNINKASKEYHIPKSTLMKKVHEDELRIGKMCCV